MSSYQYELTRSILSADCLAFFILGGPGLKDVVKSFVFAVLILFCLAALVLVVFSFPSKCELLNCHGTDFQCGPNPPEACTMMYALGDGCRKYASCEVVAGKCRLAENPLLAECISCVNYCGLRHRDDAAAAFECEAACLSK